MLAAVIFSAFVGANYKLAGGLTVISYGLAALAAMGLTEVKDHEKQSFHIGEFKEILKQTLKNKHFLLLLLAVAFLSEAHQTITVFLNQIQYEKCGLSDSVIGYVYVAVTLIGLFGAFSAWCTKKFGTYSAGMLLFCAAFASCVVLAYTQSAAVSIGAILLLRFSNTLFQPFQMELQNKQICSHNRATVLSINSMIIDSVEAGTNLVFGYLAESSLNISFLFGAGLCLIGLCLFFLWYRHWKVTL